MNADQESRRRFMREYLWIELSQFPQGLTAGELAFRTRRSIGAVRPRITELSELGQIKEIGSRRAPSARRGPKERVWVVVG